MTTYIITSRRLSRENGMRIKSIKFDAELNSAIAEVSYGRILENGTFGRRRTDFVTLSAEQLAAWRSSGNVDAIATEVAKTQNFTIAPYGGPQSEAPLKETVAAGSPPAPPASSDNVIPAGDTKPAGKTDKKAKTEVKASKVKK